MTDAQLQLIVEQISLNSFGFFFEHFARFNQRLRTSGGRYLLATHDIEFNPHHLRQNGMDAFVRTIKHELCHYHLHRNGQGYRHKDQDFKNLLSTVGGSRFCPDTGLKRTSPVKHIYICIHCKVEIARSRKLNVLRYVCGLCRGKLQFIETVSIVADQTIK